MFDMSKIGRTIARLRKDAGLTQMGLADAMGISFQAVSNWENGKSLPDLEMLALLSWALEVDVSTLLGEQAPPPSRRDLRRFLALAAALALLWLAARLASSYLSGLREFIYNTRPQYFYLLLVRPLLWALGGWTAVAFLHLWPGLPPIPQKGRRLLFWGGFAWCLFWFFGPVLGYVLGTSSYRIVLAAIWTLSRPWLHLPGGIAMALGVLKRR